MEWPCHGKGIFTQVYTPERRSICFVVPFVSSSRTDKTSSGCWLRLEVRIVAFFWQGAIKYEREASKKSLWGAKEMTPQLRVPAALAEDQGSVPSAYARCLTATRNRKCTQTHKATNTS